jgi:OmpA-OmpF porin, OOP family
MCMRNFMRWKQVGVVAFCALTVGMVLAHHLKDEMVLNANVLFGFDTADLSLANREALDRIVIRVRSRAPEMVSGTGRFGDEAPEIITLIGHSDRLESVGDNQMLSEDRAEAVKTYLVSLGIDPHRVQTDFKANTQPITKPGTCAEGSHAKMIECLQPDRHVVMELGLPSSLPK